MDARITFQENGEWTERITFRANDGWTDESHFPSEWLIDGPMPFQEKEGYTNRKANSHDSSITFTTHVLVG